MYIPDEIARVNGFLKKAAHCMDELAEVCKEFNINSPKEAFGFTFDTEVNRYRLFVDYEALFEGSNNATPRLYMKII